MERKLHFMENWIIFWGIWGEAELILRIWGAKEKYLQGAEVISCRDLGRSMHYFQGSREHRPLVGLINRSRPKLYVAFCLKKESDTCSSIGHDWLNILWGI